MRLYIFSPKNSIGCIGIAANNIDEAIEIGNHYKDVNDDYVGIFYKHPPNKELNLTMWVLRHDYRLHMMIDSGTQFIYL